MEQGYDGAAVENPDFPAKREEEKILERLPSDTELRITTSYFLAVPPYFLGGTLGGTVHTVSAKCTEFSPDCYTVMIGFDSPLLYLCNLYVLGIRLM